MSSIMKKKGEHNVAGLVVVEVVGGDATLAGKVRKPTVEGGGSDVDKAVVREEEEIVVALDFARREVRGLGRN